MGKKSRKDLLDCLQGDYAGKVPGWQNIVDSLQYAEKMLGLGLPSSFPISLYLAGVGIKDAVRTELFLPPNPKEQAIYYLHIKPDSFKLEDSLLFRINRTPQSFLGISEHLKLNDIIRELRELYDSHSASLVREEVVLKIPSPKLVTLDVGIEFMGTPCDKQIYRIKETDANLALQMESVINKYRAIEQFETKGLSALLEKVFEVHEDTRNFEFLDVSGLKTIGALNALSHIPPK